MDFGTVIQRSVLISCLLAIACQKSADKKEATTNTKMEAVSYDAIYVVNGGSNTISVLDANDSAVKGTVTLKGVSYPHHINMSPDRSMFMVAAPGMDLSGGHDGGMAGMKGSIVMVDAKTGETMLSKQMNGMTHNAAYSPDGKEVWAALMTMPGKLLILKADTLEIVKSLDVGDMPAEVTFSSDGKYAFVANGMSNTVSVIDSTTKQIVKQIAVGEDPVGAWTGSDGKMYVDNEKGKSISAIDTQTLKVVRTYSLGFTPGMATLATNGELWVSDSDSGKVSYFMKDSTMAMGSITVGKGAHAIVFSADGKRAFVSNQTDGTVNTIDVLSHSVMKTTIVGQKPNGIAFRQN